MTPAPWRTIEDPPAEGAPTDESGSSRPRWPIVALGCAVLLGVAAFWMAANSATGSLAVAGTGGPGDIPIRSTASGRTGPTSSAAARIFVDVAGAVMRPGVYALAPGARVTDAIAAAGGYGPRVATNRVARELNLAAPVADGGRVYVPSRDDPNDGTAGGGGSGSGAGSGSGGGTGSGPGSGAALLDLNRASQAELEALPGIGPVTAAKIIASRSSQPFRSVDDLRSRKLLGQKAFDALKSLVTVR